MDAAILLAVALSGLTQVRGTYKERFYTGACDREGVALVEDRPAGGKQLFVRVAGESQAPALAEAVTGDDGAFHMSFQPPATAAYCVAHSDKERLVCLTEFKATPIEGSAWMSVIVGPVNARTHCVSQRRTVRGRTLFAEEPCGDGGKPPRPIGGKHLSIHRLDAREADLGLASDAAGRFAASLLPGRYCVRLRQAPRGQPVPDRCLATFEVADRDVDGVTVDFKRTCGDPVALHRPGQEPLPPRARGLGRVAALGGTSHVRGQVTSHSSYWGGAYRREPPPAFTAGNVLRVRRGDKNGPRPLVAEVLTDEYGFDVALPPGVWCLETAYHDDWFRGWAGADMDDYDRACLKQRYETCDFVARLEAQDLEDVRIVTFQWNPPSYPCRLRPYAGAPPP